MNQQTLVNFQNFIIATRDSGYKNTASALAELVDNAVEAQATIIEIQINKLDDRESEQYEVLIIDNGKGMDETELAFALQFGGSSRFNSRSQLGRYGMGLPNSSLSQCRRVEVLTWKEKDNFLTTYLDVDEVVDRKLTKLLQPTKVSRSFFPVHSTSGTVVRWRKCDRLSFKYLKSLIKHIQFELGRIFRYAICRGVDIKICGEAVIPFDPLFVGNGLNIVGGESFGSELRYPVKVPGDESKISEVKVKFIELPVQEWAKLPNDEKRKSRITKWAGVTVLRSEREIDYGWFFMGDKRKENYDDWWRCEISFQPELDEVFGVTHTKQEIKETEFMKSILVPDFEQTARMLNNRVRLKFIDLKKMQPTTYAKQQLEENDVYLPALLKKQKGKGSNNRNHAKGMGYEIVVKELAQKAFYEVVEKNNNIILTINKSHIFYDKVFRALHDRHITNVAGFIKILEVILFAAARSELNFSGKTESGVICNFKDDWSLHLKTFMS